MEDGTVCPITILEDMRCRMNTTDESHQPLDNEHEKGGSRAMTFVDPSMNRSGSRSTCSHHHVTGNFGVNLAFEKLPELFISSQTHGCRRHSISMVQPNKCSPTPG
jgi:hypothetical protein